MAVKNKKDPDTGGKIDAKYAGIDSAGISNEEDSNNFFGANNASIFFQNLLGQESPIFDEDQVQYGDPPHIEKSKAKKLSDVRKKLAKNADKPTTAGAEKGNKDLPGILQQVDPQGYSQNNPQMFQQMMQITSLLGMGSGMSGGAGGGGIGTTLPAIPSGVSTVLNDSFTGALAILIKQYGFERIIYIFTAALSNGGLAEIDSRYQAIVKNTMSNIIRLALYYGPINIPVSLYDDTVWGDTVPSPLVADADVPDYYLKQYYNFVDDPYPGYWRWNSPDGTAVVYTKKPPGSLHYSTSNEEIFSTSEIQIAAALVPYCVISVPQPILTPYVLNDILYAQSDNIEVNTLNNTMGNNAGAGSGGGGSGSQMMSMLMGLLGGQLSGLLTQFTSGQLPNSVLNQGNMNQLTQQYTKDMALNNQIFQTAQGMFQGGSPMGALGNMGGLSNIMGGFNMGGGGIEGVLGGMGVGSLMGSFGGFGGSSGGGGGGAGAGFPTATPGDYSGGNITDAGLKDMSDLLTLLGITDV
jgi:hypothetical protein